MRPLHRLLLTAVLAAPGALFACSDSSSDLLNTGGGNTGGSHGNAGSTGTSNQDTTGASMSTTGSGAMCSGDDGCPAGSICVGGSCVTGCDAMHGCDGSKTCCNGQCADLTSDLAHCGSCDVTCPTPPNIDVQCNGMCQIGACDMGFYDCDGNTSNGCESSAPCVCNPGDVQACYSGPPGTENVGICKGGQRTCNISGDGYGPCLGQTLPEVETCSDGLDHDCNGTPNDVGDKDGDGWTICNGDCCDEPGGCGSDPALVNPGAYEILNDGIDNDCDPSTSDTTPTAACSTAQKFTGVTGADMAHAMDLCQFTTANPPLPQKKWGVITASQLFANGATPTGTDLTNIQNFQDAVVVNFGTGGVVPHKNATMAVFSSGRARDEGDPNWVIPISGSSYNSSISFNGATPPLGTYLAAHGGNLLAGSCGGNSCQTGTGANDSTDVRLVIRTPTNAQSFSYDFRFFSAEYQSFQCTPYNDYYLAMLQTGAMGIPADHNISFDALNNAVSVNNGFFQDCGGNGKNCNTCPFGTAALAGTGFEQVNGGATEWLTTDAPIVPGETITLDLMVFDVNDHIYDTLVLLDNFRWSPQPATVNTHT